MVWEFMSIEKWIERWVWNCGELRLWGLWYVHMEILKGIVSMHDIGIKLGILNEIEMWKGFVSFAWHWNICTIARW